LKKKIVDFETKTEDTQTVFHFSIVIFCEAARNRRDYGRDEAGRFLAINLHILQCAKKNLAFGETEEKSVVLL
jgi:hypothetical protein